jgi:hypothetical protein
MLITIQNANIKVAVGLKDCKYMNIQYIYDLYAMATEEEKQTDWYADAYHFTNDLSEKYDISPVKVAHLISAISPQQKWEKNKEYAILALQGFDAVKSGWMGKNDLPKIHKFGAMSDNGYAVLFGEAFNLGQKTASFAANIMGNKQIVTIDSLAMSILFGFYEKAGSYKIYNGAYTYAQSLYVHCANVLGIFPAQLQAVVWVVCRRLKEAHKSNVTLLNAANALGKGYTPKDILNYITQNV